LIRFSEIIEGKNIIVFGTGTAANRTIDDLREINVHPLCCIDNDPQKWGGIFKDLIVYDPKHIHNLQLANQFIIVSSMYYMDIKQQLSDLGLNEYEHYISYEDLYKFPLQFKHKIICMKYNLTYNKEGSLIENHIMEIVRSFDVNEKTVIWGVGEHTTQLLNLIGSQIDLAFVVDPDPAQPESYFEGLVVKSPDQLEVERVKRVLISSFEERKFIKDSMSKKYPLIEFIDFYEILDDMFVCSRPFYSWDHSFFFHFMEAHFLKYRIKHEKNFGMLQMLYRQLISLILHLKDFEDLKEIVDEYISNGFPDADEMLDMYNEVDIMLSEAKGIIHNRSYRDIVLFVFDSMRQQDISLAPYLKSLLSNSYEFRNAFSTSTYTRASFMGMFSNQKDEGINLLPREVDGSESDLFKWLNSNKYSLFQYGHYPIKNVPNLQYVEAELLKKTMWLPFTVRWWEIICRLAYVEAPQFHIINISEAHHPFICTKLRSDVMNLDYIPYHYYQYPENDYSGSQMQHDEVVSYLDTTMRYTHSFFSEHTLSVICSDHGAEVGEGPVGHLMTCSESTIHVPLIIYRPDFSHKVFEELYSQKNIGKLIIGLMENGEVDSSIFSSYVVVERDPIYSSIYFKDSIKQNAGNWLRAFRMVRNQMYKYILFENGDERLYKLPNEQRDLINDPQHLEVLEELRAKVSAVFPYKI
jgi:Predicted membrane-associated, metal-dependent hydrolase